MTRACHSPVRMATGDAFTDAEIDDIAPAQLEGGAARHHALVVTKIATHRITHRLVTRHDLVRVNRHTTRNANALKLTRLTRQEQHAHEPVSAVSLV